jgi:hypothetical protein
VTCVRGCCPSQAEHFRSVVLSRGALADLNRREAKLSRDMVAYRSMVDQGLEPHTLTGAHEMQDASADQIEGRMPWLPPPTS